MTRLGTDAAGHIDALAATFDQHGEGRPHLPWHDPPLRLTGAARYTAGPAGRSCGRPRFRVTRAPT
ncbi:hypothetical protein G3I60_04475 [Streptomyces sp. SID13666]|uniref:hypothetical protein n=1 Tax=Streptomyces sp. SID13666 TaxID=2706054 RepID=UPI0013C25735|nr:hypothetical protein [Streptomyces sp. SID13666]NEA53436.1 hypothetical protein [Streptomyces sp. SID13666]